MESIPCEICSQNIPVESYVNHVRNHALSQNVVIPISSRFLTDIDSDDIEDDDEVQHYITSNNQIQGNLQTFLQNHFNGSIRRGSNPNTPGSSPPTVYLTMPSSFILSEDVAKSGIANLDEISELVSQYSNEEEKYIMCVICQDVIKFPCRKLLCNHLYCETCILMWMTRHTKCPICQFEYAYK